MFGIPLFYETISCTGACHYSSFVVRPEDELFVFPDTCSTRRPRKHLDPTHTIVLPLVGSWHSCRTVFGSYGFPMDARPFRSIHFDRTTQSFRCIHWPHHSDMCIHRCHAPDSSRLQPVTGGLDREFHLGSRFRFSVFCRFRRRRRVSTLAWRLRLHCQWRWEAKKWELGCHCSIIWQSPIFRHHSTIPETGLEGGFFLLFELTMIE